MNRILLSLVLLPAFCFAAGTMPNVNAPQQPHAVLIGPASGSSTGIATFRALTAADIQAAGGVGITSLNGLSSGTQTFTTGTTGSNFNISSLSTTHTFNLPTADGGTTGKLSSTDWITFNAKQSTTTTLTALNTLNGAANGFVVNTGAGATFTTGSILGTTNKVIVTNGTGPTVTLSLPQAIATNSSVTFGDVTAGNFIGGVWQGTEISASVGGTGLNTIAQGDLIYGAAGLSYSRLTKNTTATRYLSNTGTNNDPAWAQIDLSNGITGIIPVANGGTNVSSYTKGDILIASAGTTLTKLTVGTTGNQTLVPDSTQTTGIKWSVVSSIQGGPRLSGVSYPVIRAQNLSNGNNDLYTVPAGKRLWVNGVALYNQGVGSIVSKLLLKSGVTYYRISANTLAMGTLTSATINVQNILLDPGDVLAINNDVTGLNVAVSCTLFDSTCGFFTARILGLANGDNTLYTCPASKTARGFGATGTFGVGLVSMSNDSGGTRSVKAYTVLSGQSSGANYQTGGPQNVGDATVGNVTYGNLSAGDFVVINTNSATATQSAFITIIEQDL